MPKYTHDWIDDLDSMLVMEEDYCRDEMRHYKDGPDHDLYAAHLANVTELQRRLRLYDAADELLACLRKVRAQLPELGVDYYGHTIDKTCEMIDAVLVAAERRSHGNV